MSKNVQSQNRGFVILLFGGFLYSLYGVFSRVIGSSIPQFFQIWSRAAIVIGFLYIALLLTKTSLKRIEKQDWKWVLIVAASAGLIHPPFYIAINNMPIGTMLFAFYAVSTVVSYLLGKVLFKERLSKIKALSLFIAASGLLLLYTDTLHFGNPYYLILAGLSGFLFGVNISFIKKINTKYHTLQVNLFNWTGALVVSLLASLFLSEHWTFSLSTLPWVANVGLAICSFAASFSVIYGLKFIEIQKGSIILLSELVFGVLLGIVLYHEIPTITSMIGSILVLVALLLPNLSNFRKHP